ncbi:MAG: Ig-like domain-containing protein [Sandaracinaceae bacterium]|nr:Ig-like domain-containing protein [Sandaracinaceae bacterium]
MRSALALEEHTMKKIALALSLLSGLAACGGPAPDPDAGRDSGPMQGDAGHDAGEVETTPPAVLATIPDDGAAEVDPSTTIRVVFSEPIDVAAGGTISAAAGDEDVALGTPAFDDDARELTVAPLAPLPGNTAIEVTVGGYRDLAGNAMAAAHVFSFTTSDPFAPTVVSATPAEGASDVSATTSAIEVEFSEPMSATLGVGALIGGPGALGAATWDGARATFAVSGLAPDTAYRVVLVGFADAAGNALDGEPYLGDGALDFTTGGDDVAPVVTEASPAEGATGVPPTRTTRVRVVFSEPMDPSAGTAELDRDGTTTALTASWAAGDTVLLLDVSGLLEEGLDYRVTLDGFTDAAGNALDGATYLGDGALDFSTGDDELAPFVLYSNPAEGMTGVRWTTNSLFVTFSEPMDTTRTTVPFNDGEIGSLFDATWSSGGTLLEIDVAGRLISARTYVLDFTAFTDAEGTALDATHAYLGDGQLTFTMAAPEGENCQDYLTSAEATVTAGVYEWTIAATQVANVDGAAPCDASGGSADAVVRYTKTTPDSTATTGGTVLRVTVTSSSTLTDRDINVDVLRDACDPTTSMTARLACRANGNPHSFDLDVGPGDYYVWVAASAATFRGATVRIEEIPAGVGDTCRNAIPITVGTTAVTAGGTASIAAPSCVGGAALTWYRFTTADGLSFVRTNGSSIGGVVDATTGQAMRCGDNAQTEGVAVFAPPGTDVCVALTSTPSVTSISIDGMPYSGVRGIETDLGIQRPAGAPITPTLGGTGWMAPHAGRIWSGRFNNIFHAPLTGGDYTWDALASGFGCRYAGLVRPDGLYCVRETTAVDAHRLQRVVDATGTPLETPVPVDVLPDGFTYVNRRFDGLTFDGTSFLVGTSSSTGTSTEASTYYSIPAAGGAPTLLGTNDSLHDVGALAADADFLYVYGRVGTGEGIWRLRRDQLSDPAQAPVLVAGGYDLITDGGSIAIDDTTSANVLYFRAIGNTGSSAHIIVVVDPRAATPRWIGPLWRAPGNRQDNGFGYDPSGPSIYLIHTNTTTSGTWLRLD